jgi:hypothetical protein
MNAETTNLTTVTPDDLRLVRDELAASPRPLSLRELAEKLAFQKTAGQRARDVKKYDPESIYEVGDMLYKEYNEPLTVGSKNVEHFQGAVILTVVAKQAYHPNFRCEMLEVDYPGGGTFRKYIDYMKKTRTQVLLPSNCDRLAKPIEVLDKASDPRLTELPMTERDLRFLEKALRSGLVKSPEVFSWNDRFQLAAKRVDIPEEKIKDIEAGLASASAATEDLIRRHFGLEPSHDLFELHCLSLDALLDKKHKKDFVLLSDRGWGRWHLKKVLNAMPDGLPLAASTARLPELEALEKPEMSVVSSFPIKIYLTWREILSGGVKIPRSLGKELGHGREFVFTDPEENKAYTCVYFPAGNYFLGLGEFYAAKNIPQGTSLTLEKAGPAAFNFWVKKSKKKLAAPRLSYNSATDAFRDSGEDAFTFAEPNKIIYIERETLARLLPLAAGRAEKDLHELLVLVFKTPGLTASGHELHFLRAYHLVDLIRHTTQEDVETTLLNTAEFSKSDKKGIFVYQELYALVPAVEAEAEPGAEVPEEAPAFAPEAVAFDELEDEGGLVILSRPSAGTAVEPEFVPPAPLPTRPERPAPFETPAPAGPEPTGKKEKPAKKKKPKAEGDRVVRPGKSERRIIEERIVEEESEAEALSAIKEKEEEGAETRRERERADDLKPEAKETPKFGGFFADVLKSALKKKPEDAPPAEPEKPAKGKKAGQPAPPKKSEPEPGKGRDRG